MRGNRSNGNRPLIPYFEIDGAEVARSLVEAGIGVTVLPECMVPIETTARSAILHINEPWAVRTMRIGKRRGKPITAGTKALIHQLTEQPQPATSA